MRQFAGNGRCWALYRAVIVDDEPFMLEGMRLMIDWAACGFTLSGEAATAQEALRLVDTVKPHLLVTDVLMPGMLGTDLAGIMRRYHPETLLLFFSGYKDFSFARSAIRAQAFGYLVKPIDRDEVHQVLMEAKKELDSRNRRDQEQGERLPILRDHVLRRIAGGDAGEESLMRAGVLLEIGRGDPCWCAVITAQDKPLSQGALMMLAGCGAMPFLLSPNQCGLCFRRMERDLSQLETLKDLLANDFETQVTVGVGQADFGPEGFARSLCQALDALGVLFEPQGGLRLYRPWDETASAWLMEVHLPGLVKALSGSNEELDAKTEEIRTLMRQEQPSLFALRLMAKQLQTLLQLHAVQSGRPARGNDALRPLWASLTLNRETWMDAFCDTLRSLKELPGGNALPASVAAALNLVRQEYGKPLSIGDVAARLHMNPAYLGQLILKATGQTFRWLLMDARISNACYLLRQTARPIGEIAFTVGFRDVDYFSRQFRVRMGMSPMAYRDPAAEGGMLNEAARR